MRKLFSAAICFSLLCAPAAGWAQRRRGAAGSAADGAVNARFIVQLIYDDEYKSATDKPNEIDPSRPHDTGRAESRLHFEMQASRWIKIQPGDGGSTELLALTGGEPSAASGAVTLTASEETRSDDSTGEKNRVVSQTDSSINFHGDIVSPEVTRDESPVSLNVPQFSDDGGGLEFTLKVTARLKGSCQKSYVDEHGTRKSGDCSGVSVAAEGFNVTGENQETDKSVGAAYVAEFSEEFTFKPALSPEEQQRASGIAGLETEPGLWYGAQTRGDRRSGYKITLAKTKTVIKEARDGTAREQVQKVSLNAEIVTGGSAGRLTPNSSKENGGASLMMDKSPQTVEARPTDEPAHYVEVFDVSDKEGRLREPGSCLTHAHFTRRREPPAGSERFVLGPGQAGWRAILRG